MVRDAAKFVLEVAIDDDGVGDDFLEDVSKFFQEFLPLGLWDEQPFRVQGGFKADMEVGDDECFFFDEEEGVS